jgi:protein-L-isoaspartate O-methyltransferase
MVIPIGSRTEQHLVRVTRRAGLEPRREYLGPCRFVPLIGPDAWPADVL